MTTRNWDMVQPHQLGVGTMKSDNHGKTTLSAFRRIGVATLTVTLAAMAAAPAAGTDLAASGSWTITVNIPNFTWSSYGCNELPVTIIAAGDVGEWDVVMPVRLRGSGRNSDTIMASGDAPGEVGDALTLCPDDLNGTYVASGLASAGDPRTQAKLETTFQVTPMASATTLAEIAVVGHRTRFSGWVSTTSATLGAIGGKPGSKVEIQRQTSSGWSTVGSGKLDNLGNFSVHVAHTYAGGTIFRAHSVGATEIDSSVSAGLAAPASAPSKPVIRSLARTAGTAKLTWRSQGAGVTFKYRISAPGQVYGPWIVTASNSAKFTGLVRGSKYRVQVLAVNDAGSSKAKTVDFRSR